MNITVRIDEGFKKKLQAIADKEERLLSDCIRRILKKEVDNYDSEA